MMSQSNKIAFVIPSLVKGGAERVASRLADYCAEQLKMDVTIIVFYDVKDPYPVSKNLRILNLNLPPSNVKLFKPFRLIQRAIRLRACFKKNQFDGIFCFMEVANIPAILTGFPVIVSTRVSLSAARKSLIWFYHFKNVKQIVALTQKMKNDFCQYYLNKVTVIPNPIVVFNEPVFSIQQKINTPYFLSVGRYTAQKNFSLLINAFARISFKHEFSLYIAGEGELRETLTKLVIDLKLEDRVFLLGLQDDAQLDMLYKHAYATVLSSDFEGFPNVLPESLVRGTPVIATDCPDGPADIVQHDQNGLLIPMNDSDAMRDALSTLISKPELRQRYSNNACHSVGQLMIDEIAKKWLSLISK